MQRNRVHFYTKLDRWNAHNILHFAPGEEWRTVFGIREGLYQSLVVPFSMTNIPVKFQNFINNVLASFLDIFVSAYLYNILIY